jgi:ribosomal protein L23
MALFSSNKKRETKESVTRKRHAHAATSSHGVAHEIVRAPWFSEKALLVTEKGVYTFSVPSEATKAQIAGAIKEIYNVAPKKIRIVNLPGKRKALRSKRGFGTRAARRKAYVYLNAGDTIQFS